VFQNAELKNHLETSLSIKSESAVVAEWNMNIPGNIQKLGNYRYRESSTDFNVLPNFFDPLDEGLFYTGATDADVTVELGFEDEQLTPQLFFYPKDKEKLLYSLEDCIKPFRPRSGINKLSYFNNKYLPFENKDMYLRPRYYMSTKDDEFKYWRSYRTESNSQTGINVERGISRNTAQNRYPIDDTNPFVVYKEQVPANRIILKVQTNIGNINLGPFKNSGGSSIADPFFGDQNKTVPRSFKVQYLDENNQWLNAAEFNDASFREDGITPIFGSDGYLSLEYGLKVPTAYRNNFRLLATLKSASTLPLGPGVVKGVAYLVVPTDGDKGTLYIYNGAEYEQSLPVYDWHLGTDGTYENTHFITDFTNPSYYNESGQAARTYREFVWLKGIRVVVETMSIPNVPLELIEISPRLTSNLSDSLIDFDVTKAAADLSGSALPVGQIMAGIGSINLFDGDQSFNPTNEWRIDPETGNYIGSIIAKYIEKNIKFTFYEVIKDVNSDNYYVPIKTLYSETFPQRDAKTGETLIPLRDFYFYFESLKAPRILLTETSLSQAVCLLLDSIGFSNYVFKRKEGVSDPVVPYFFIPPEQSVAETLAQLARATQSAMFFDEYNNFVVMTKEYILDESIDRLPDITLYGSSVNGKLPNIQDVASKERKVYNAGTVNYTTRYIKRVGGTIAQNNAATAPADRSYVYNPSLLWESSGSETTTSANNNKQERFALSAVPLNTTLTAALPEVSVAGVIVNNTFDVGENAYWLARFQGFFYANGEVIRYDAVEYNITGTGNIWISSNLEYQRYFSNIPFNGKIYPTGLVRIYAEPFYETFFGIGVSQGGQEINEAIRLKVGPVVSHGRGQFGTPVTSHSAGLDPYWSNNDNIQGCEMDSSLIFNTNIDKTFPTTISGATGLSKNTAEKTQRNGIIRNFLSSKYSTETQVGSLKTTTTATLQSSALVMTGPDFAPGVVSRDFVSYVHKKLDKAYKHYGTRVRIIGKIEASGDRAQTVIGGMTYFNVPTYDPSKAISVGGGSAGINIVNPLTNNGYYFEIAALTASNIETLINRSSETGEAELALDNILFYKVRKNADLAQTKAIPVRLWSGSGNILVDDGNFAGQSRITGEQNPTVYDLAIEYVDVSPTRRDFYLYINQKIVARVTDTDPIDLVNSSVGLFVRGNAKAMFENVYALGKNFATNTVFDTNVPIARVFGDQDGSVNATEALSRYAMSGMIQNTYLSGINPQSTPSYDLYFEEFGTIMRECAYFNIKYDRAYPALYAKIAPTANRLKGYTVSGFTADSYGAEFLVFNNTDTTLSLDEKTGNYLRILGIAFTQDTTASLTVDDYLKKRGNLSDPELQGSTLVESPFKFTEQFEKVKQSRILYGKNDFTLDSIYIQDQDSAESILGWIIEKNIRPRKSVGLNIFSMPTLQLGDIVNIYYKDKDGIDMIDSESKKYVVYNINYKRSSAGPAMSVYLSEV
jgi:hypothetical protein